MRPLKLLSFIRATIAALCAIQFASLAPPTSACPHEEAAALFEGHAIDAASLTRRQLALDNPSPAQPFPIVPGDCNEDVVPGDNCSESVVPSLVGVTGTIEFMMTASEHFPQYTSTWQGGLDWVESKAMPGNPGLKWEAEYCDGLVGSGYISNVWIANTFARAYTLSGDIHNLDVARDALKWVKCGHFPASTFYCKADGTPSDGWIWIEFSRPHAPEFYNIGALHGVTAIGRHALEVYRIAGTTHMAGTLGREIAIQVGKTIRDTANTDPVYSQPGSPAYFWHTINGPGDGGNACAQFPNVGDNDVSKTAGFCFGTAGIVEFLIEMDKTFGDTDPLYENLARGGLEWLVRSKEDLGNSMYRWKVNAAAPVPGYTPTVGYGATGVGRALLEGYRWFGNTHYLDNAKGAGNWIVSEADAFASGTQFAWGDNYLGNYTHLTGWCRGTPGVAYYLYNLWQTSGVNSYRIAALKAANWLSAQQVTLVHGTTVPMEAGGTHIQNGFAWGVASLHNPTYAATINGPFEESSPLVNVLINTTEYLDAVKIPDAASGGHYWTQSLPYELPPASFFMDGVGEPIDSATPPSKVVSTVLTPDSPPFRARWNLDTPRVGKARAAHGMVVDVTGRRVREGLHVDVTETEVRTNWDGRDEAGTFVQSGPYFLRVTVGETVLSTKVAVLR